MHRINAKSLKTKYRLEMHFQKCTYVHFYATKWIIVKNAMEYKGLMNSRRRRHGMPKINAYVNDSSENLILDV